MQKRSEFLRDIVGVVVGAILVGLVLGRGATAAGDNPTTQVVCAETANTGLSTTSETVFSDSTGLRVKWCIANEHATIGIRLKLGSTASATTSLYVAPNSTLCDGAESGFIWTGPIDAIATSGTPGISGFECTRKW